MKNDSLRVAAIIVAAGKGVRMGKGTKKQYLLLGDTPILAYSIISFHSCKVVDEIYLVIGEGDRDMCQRSVLSPLVLEKPVWLVQGGNSRQESVYNGLEAAKGKCDIVAIHDGVRPLIRVPEITKTIETASLFGAAIPAVYAKDTVKKVTKDDYVEATLDRGTIRLAQTPQAFRFDIIYDAHTAARNANYEGTDDAALVERQGIPVKIISGSPENIKITTPEDVATAKTFL